MGNRSGTKTRVELDEAAIRAKAHELWLQRGCPDGNAEQDWFEAQRLLQAETPAAPKVRTSSPPQAAPQPELEEDQPPSSARSRGRGSSEDDELSESASPPSGERGDGDPPSGSKRPSRAPAAAARARVRKR
jgi:hypothetical protein